MTQRSYLEVDVDIDDLLGIDRSDPQQALAIEQMEQDDALLDALIQRRRELGRTQQEVADRLGITQSAVARFEGGDRDPRLSTLRRYALAVESLVTHSVTAPLRSAADVEWERIVTTLKSETKHASRWTTVGIGRQGAELVSAYTRTLRRE